MQRRLAAILAADVVGYSKMMGSDETATLDALRTLTTEVLQPTTSGNNGDIVKSMGDGWLIAFNSASEAVNAAMSIQDAISKRTDLKLRIGVHLGDVTFAENDIFGDGVNIAARLEGLSDPGGITISDPVYYSIDGTLSPSFDDGGERTLKNISRAVRVWVRVPAIETPELISVAGVSSNLPKLCIQPVACSDPRTELRDLAEALTFDFGTYFNPVVWLQTAISEERAADAYLLRAVLRARGDRLRLETRLSAPDGQEIWTEKLDGMLANSFEWQDTIGETVVSNSVSAVLDAEVRKIETYDSSSLTAEQCLLMGMMTWRNFEPASFARAAAFQTRAIEDNPDMIPAYAEAIMITVAGKTVGYHESLAQYAARLPEWMAAARRFAGQSPILDLNVAIASYFDDKDAGAFSLKLADILRRAPFDARVLSFGGWGYIWSGRPDLAYDCFEKSLRFGRMNTFYIASLGGAATALLQLGRDEEALSYCKSGMAISTTYATLYSTAAAAYANLGRQKEAEHALARHLELAPDRTLTSWKSYNDYGGSEGGARYFAALKKAGMPE